MRQDFLLVLLEGWLGHRLVVPASGFIILIPVLIANVLSAYVRPIGWGSIGSQILVLMPILVISPFPRELLLVPALLAGLFWMLDVRYRLAARAFVRHVDAFTGCVVIAFAVCVGVLMFSFGLFSGEKQWLVASNWIVAFIAFVLAVWRWRVLNSSHPVL